MSPVVVYAGFLAIVLGAGSVIGQTTGPDAWYAQLAKPPFNPPDWVFGPVWTVLYILIALAGARTWMRNAHGTAMELWGAQMILNFLWSPVFFGAHQIGLALGIVALMLVTIALFIWRSWSEDRIAATLFIPYAAWVSFAAVLNGSILLLN